MARIQKYSEELLLEAVIDYSKVCKGKIKATQVAEWASNNKEGLEGVRDYHFLRSKKVMDPSTGKRKMVEKSCMLRMQEINNARDTAYNVNTNMLLKNSNIEEFFSMSKSNQRQQILLTREQVDCLVVENQKLRLENDRVHKENALCKEKMAEQERIIIDIVKKQEKLNKKVNYIVPILENGMQREILEQIGISDGGFDLETFNNSLCVDIKASFNINNAINNERNNKKKSFADEILEGIEFD